MVAGRHDIFAEQGSSFSLYMEYQTSGNTAISLSGWSADMQVRRYKTDSDIIAHFYGNTAASYFLGGGSTGSYVSGLGIVGTGGILLNASSTGGTGNSGIGITGGIYISAHANMMSNFPIGRHHYDLEINQNDLTTIRLVEGFFDVSGEISR